MLPETVISLPTIKLSDIDKLLPLLSLIVAVLAVFFGPLISWLVAENQTKISLKVANKQIIAPMRQQWINNLRDTITELLSKSVHYFASGYDERTDAEDLRMTELHNKIELVIIPKEHDHIKLSNLTNLMLETIHGENLVESKAFMKSHIEIKELAQKIFKDEWDRVKSDI